MAAAGFLLICGLALIAFVVCLGPCFGVFAFSIVEKTTGSVKTVKITGHTWERKIDVEEVVKDWDEDWCSKVPKNATITDRWTDRSDRLKRERCEYWTPEWDEVDSVKKSGTGLKPKPSWPRVRDDGCSKLGCQRPGDKHETYEVLFDHPSGREADCDLDAKDWRSWKKGDKAKIHIGGIIGTPYCDTMRR